LYRQHRGANNARAKAMETKTTPWNFWRVPVTSSDLIKVIEEYAITR
jgi:hypothetical protein